MDFLVSDFDSHSDSSSSDDQDDLDSLFGGQARNIFSSLEETIENIDDFLLFEPQFRYEDIVCMVSDSSGKMGKVVDMEINVDLENIYGDKIYNIDSRHLRKIRAVSVNDYVVMGVWLGRVEKIVDLVTIVFECGRKRQMLTNGPDKIIAVSSDLVDDPRYPFYPGQRVQVESHVSTSTHWLCGNRSVKRDRGIVCKVDAGLVYVDWLDCLSIRGEKQPAPRSLQDSKNVTLLSSFSNANWQLGEWCSLETHSKSGIMNRNDAVSHNIEEIAVIVKTKTKVDVQWQDGILSQGLDSHLLYLVNVLDIHDFWPDSVVLEKGIANQVLDNQMWGIVGSVDSTERTVKVKWCKPCSNEVFDNEKSEEETVSAYALIKHPDYSYSLGDTVFRKELSAYIDIGDTTFTEKEHQKMCKEEEGDPENAHEQSFLDYIGIVTGFRKGYVEVKWASGVSSKVAPFEIYQADKCEATTSTSMLTIENLPQSNETNQIKDSQLLGEKAKDVRSLNFSGFKDSISQHFRTSAIEFFNGISTSIIKSLGASLSGAFRGTSEDEQRLIQFNKDQVLELGNMYSSDQLLPIDDSKILEMTLSNKSLEVNEDTSLPSCSKLPELFKQFDMVSGCSDHHFVNKFGTESQPFLKKSGWLKKLHQEWSILEENLPETIYVRVYEDRMDLIRAAIVGSAGTPYHDGLFFFDICLPPQYPNEPPMVYYNSGGFRINPNLYESGKICLSLLNTWTGSNTEVWNPGSSTVLQVLLSIQALVLNEKPYFNEAGYESQIGKSEGERNSINYNENTFLVSCKSMLYLIQNPPKHFEGLVKEHFSKQGSNILLACKAYMEGSSIGYPFTNRENGQENQSGSGNSTGFKLMLGKLVPRLEKAFSAIGADCSSIL